jgi:predicted outer membrane protein
MMKPGHPSQLVLGVVLAGAVAAACAHGGNAVQMQAEPPTASSDTSAAPSAASLAASDPSLNAQPAMQQPSPTPQEVPPPLATPDPNGAAAATLSPASSSETFPAQGGQPFTVPISQDPRATAPSESAVGGTPEKIGPSASLQRMQAFDVGEIAMAQLAVINGSKQVSAFGKKVLRDRSASEVEVNKLAAQLRVHLDQSDEMAQSELRGDRAELASLQALIGAAFDQAYARHMIKDRHAAIDALTTLRGAASEQRIAKLIGKLLPSLQREEREARALRVSGVASAGNP